MENFTMNIAKTAAMMDKPAPPNLLLSYTYFLNAAHTFYISIGYDVYDFRQKVVINKNGNFHVFTYEDWKNLYNNKQNIENHFASDQRVSNNELPRAGGACIFRLTTRTNDKSLIIVEGGKKIVINSSEWKYFQTLLHFLNSIICWGNSVWTEIENYYAMYLTRCVELNVGKLVQQEFFMPFMIMYNYCNYSRLFNEIPILCKERLTNDLYNAGGN